MANGTHTLEVWGDLACFTRPEMKVERFSYPVMTPSAARGIFDAIYWDGRRDGPLMRPYFHWQVTRIEILEFPRYIALRRNEVKDRVPATAVLNKWMKGTVAPGIARPIGRARIETCACKGLPTSTRRITRPIGRVRIETHRG